MTDRPHRLRQWFPWLAVLGSALVVLSLMCASAWYGWFGWTFFLFVFIPFAVVLGTFAFLVAGIGAMFRSKGNDAWHWPNTVFLVSATSYVLAGMAFVSFFAILDLENSALDRAASRAVPLCEAIRSYVRDRGATPESLDDLVPEWIAEVPSTSVLACPSYLYDSAEDRGDLAPTWSLRIACSRGPLNWDQFLYYPDGDYTGAGPRWGGEHVARGDWVYVFE